MPLMCCCADDARIGAPEDVAFAETVEGLTNEVRPPADQPLASAAPADPPLAPAEDTDPIVATRKPAEELPDAEKQNATVNTSDQAITSVPQVEAMPEVPQKAQAEQERPTEAGPVVQVADSKPDPKLALPTAAEAVAEDSKKRDSEGGSTPVGEGGTPRGSTTPNSRISGAATHAINLVKMMTDPRNIKNFIYEIALFEIFAKQIPLALILALPTFAMDFLVGLALKPQNEMIFEDEAHRQANNASFNVHIDYNPGPQEKGVLGSAMIGNVCLLLSLTGWFLWIQLYIPWCALTKEQFTAATPKSWTVCLGVFMPFMIGLLFLGGINAGKVDGGHHYAAVGTLSPVIIVIVFYAILSTWRGRLINRAANTNLWLVGLTVILVTAVTITVEVIYILGINSMTPQRKELVIFLYRAIIWPIIWYVFLVPLFRYVLLMTGGDLTNSIPFLGFVLSITSVSSRTVMFAIDSNVFFIILALEDTLVQCIFNFYWRGQPIADTFILKNLWRRCIKLSDTGEVALFDDERARMMRMFWFQAQSVVELTVVFSQTVRTFALYDSRHIFGNMFRPNCEMLNEFDLTDLMIKLLISVATITAGDLASSYVVFCKGFPLAEAFSVMLRSHRSWVSFSFMNICAFGLLTMTMIPVIGRVGRCTDFNNGCTCVGIVMYQEICGCCGLSDAQAAASPYPICSA